MAAVLTIAALVVALTLLEAIRQNSEAARLRQRLAEALRQRDQAQQERDGALAALRDLTRSATDPQIREANARADRAEDDADLLRRQVLDLQRQLLACGGDVTAVAKACDVYDDGDAS